MSMIIREASNEDRNKWDAFVDSEGGLFTHYFDWRQVFEARGYQYISLLAETSASEIIGILPMIKEKRLFSSILFSDTQAGGILLKRELSDVERNQAISAFLNYVNTNHSKRCSRFILSENLSATNDANEIPTAAIIDSGYRFRYNTSTQLPCTFILESERPFQENIWKEMWTRNLKKKISKVERTGATVIRDQELKYAGVFIDMLSANYERHDSMPLTKEQVKIALDIFKEKAKLFVVLMDNRPVVATVCLYNTSTCLLWEIGSYVKDTGNMNILCYKAAIEDACNTGYKYIDFGLTATSNLAFFKEQFKGSRVPLRIYEKRFSIPMTIIELVPIMLKRVWNDKTYLWKIRRKLWDSIIHW